MSPEAAWVDRACPLCGSRDQARVFAESNIDLAKLDGFAFASRKRPEYMHPRLIECSGCGLLYGSPVLSPDSLAREYQDSQFDSGEEARYASFSYRDVVRPVLGQLPDLESALDLGTGDGAFLERLLETGFSSVAGVEPAEAPVRAARPGIRGLIRNSVFRPEDFRPASYSLITCFQTLEHLWNPLETARNAATLLKPGGAFVTVVHDRRALTARVLGLRSPIFDIEHLQLFCRATVRSLLERAGLHRVLVRPIWNRYPLHYWVRLAPLPGGIKPAFQKAAAGRAGSVPLALPAGNLACIGFR